ncbi:MAG: penicillin-binding transpeptidase domain-containing protein [Myxococcota bacterium]|nr:penicillin-binding transpeptidase domain-containing protein [Myxococcota bacterium]
MRLLALLFVGACASASAKSPADWADGCFMYRDAAGKVHESNRARCAKPRRPYSTFKVPSALIAVDAGVLDGADAQMTWDKARVPDEKKYLDVWRKPHTLRTGIAVSAVPYFRTLALQIGEEKMKAGLAKLDYGNQDISGGLDKFWLSGGIRISAAQQLAFVDALANKKLAVSEKAHAVLAEITVLAKTDSAVLHGKTGSGPIEHGKGGWLVWQIGWIEKDGKLLPYAAWMESKAKKLDDARAARDTRLRATLDALGMFPK